MNEFCKLAYETSVLSGWWPEEDRQNPYIVPLKLSLIHSEISEALEGFRKDQMDDHLPSRKMVEVELADAIIRIGDLAGFLGLDLDGAIEEKMAYNKTRADHQKSNRESQGGKKF